MAATCNLFQVFSRVTAPGTCSKVGTRRRRPVVTPVRCVGNDEASSPGERSNYSQTSGFVKGVVSGLTALVNTVMEGPGGASRATSEEEWSAREADRPLPSVPRSPDQLVDGIRAEFVDNCYLWTGDITEEMYALRCTFTDPTLSFTGLDTFKRNLDNLQPILRRVVKERSIELYACELCGEGEDAAVRAQWRMIGDLALPWRPRIDLKGQTTFRFEDRGAERGCLITAYQEEWEISGGDAVMQLLRPFQW